MRIAAPGTPGSELAPPRSSPQAPPGLDPDVLPAGWPQRLGPDDWAVFKPRWGAFSRTCLEELLTLAELLARVHPGHPWIAGL
ncbi:hypothetical protein PH213_36335 [Streptomyces sp. SRF1]|uniref:hypothetical protein n=1 Tax=Streptomyces sp. SRF1 TaxID=1549642 RepID=UPI0025AF4ED3|nr:hypothetical protein [Streptomyces sp. SRF1]MDN3059899.1 hypothetical protein [Streptomyces sp. SRF1]